MSSSGSKGSLASATRQLSSRWTETRKTWRDHKAMEFEQVYLAELFHRVEDTFRVLDDLDQLLHKVHAECD
ncbi:MAG: hypothetical protein KF712_14060 [Akkermansiaceae bacterium]|nr:hypothetical protein [Akkermansiaceae bacterium]